MPESSLSLQLSDLAVSVGSYLGYGRTAANWSGWQAGSPYVASGPDTQLSHILECIQEGLRRFYFPTIHDHNKGVAAHKWSFLTPERTLQTIVGQGVQDLPDDFAGLEGELTYQPTDSTWYTVQRVGQGQINRYVQQLFGIQDKPRACAIYPKQTDGAMGQRFQISFAPIPDAVYTLTYYCNILPQALSATYPYPYGGAAHGSTIIESCLAVAEERFNDETGGVHAQAFLERLEASISVDIRDFRPAYFGYNGDRSDARDVAFPNWGIPGSTIATGVQHNGSPIT